MVRAILTVAGVLALTACGGASESEKVSGEEAARKLEQAADQSVPEARPVLEASADAARAQESVAPLDQPGSLTQDAMQKAGKAAMGASETAAASPKAT